MKQLSIFLENRAGRLSDALRILADSQINLLSLSLADTSEYGMLRLLVSEPEDALLAIRRAGMSATLTDVVAVALPHEVGALQKALTILCDAQINIEYMYALYTGTKEAAIAIKTSAPGVACDLLAGAGFKLLK